MRAYRYTGGEELIAARHDVPNPSLRPGQVIVGVKAASLNYRDLLQAKSDVGLVPLSDGAGVILAVAPDVVGRAVGDRVVIGFMPGWIEGDFDAAKQASALGGAGIDGVLADQVAVPVSATVPIPADMSFEEAATLPCAGVTAWSALFERRPLQPGESVLLLGTGGVSIFALQMAKLAGARVIITSSSDDKLERARALGADDLINYHRNGQWAAEVLRLTGGLGADLGVDVGGPGTLNSTLNAVRHGGRISLMGVLSGFSGPVDTAAILSKRITLQGIYVGSVAALATVVRLKLTPVIDEVFSFDTAAAAFQRMRDGAHFGKLVIRIAP